MTIRFIKIVGDADQADIKLGSSMNSEHKEIIALRKNGIAPPDSLLAYLHPAPISIKQELLISKGLQEEARRILNYSGYLQFTTSDSDEFGYIDPSYKSKKIKVANIIYNPELGVPITKFVEGINWLWNYIQKNKGKGTIGANTDVFLLTKEVIPTRMTRELTIEDFKEEKVKEAPVELG
jgi:hypothetical protein